MMAHIHTEQNVNRLGWVLHFLLLSIHCPTVLLAHHKTHTDIAVCIHLKYVTKWPAKWSKNQSQMLRQNLERRKRVLKHACLNFHSIQIRNNATCAYSETYLFLSCSAYELSFPFVSSWPLKISPFCTLLTCLYRVLIKISL